MKKSIIPVLIILFSVVQSVFSADFFENTQNFTINDKVISIKQTGDQTGKPTVLLLPGEYKSYDHIIQNIMAPMLKDAANLIRFHSDNDSLSADEMAVLLKKLNIKSVHLLALSAAAELAIDFANEHPQYLQSVIFSSPIQLNGGTLINQVMHLYKVGNPAEKQKIGKIMKKDRDINVQFFHTWDSLSFATIDSFLFHKPQLGKVLRQNRTGVNSDIYYRKHFFSSHSTSAIDTASFSHFKTLILTGIRDETESFDYSQYLHDNIPGNQEVFFYESDHFPEIEEPHHYFKSIVQFINQ